MTVLITPRLILRRWQESDRQPFAAINADPRVMEFFPHLLTCEQSDQLIDRIEAGFAQQGFGLCAVERQSDHSFLGFIGLSVPNFHAHFTPCVEIGWRLVVHAWGQGFAMEGARAVAAYAFDKLKLATLVSFTAEQNIRSRHVMEKIGMTFDPAETFDHPNLPEGHLLRRHVLYRLRAEEFANP
ncbi:GNAT family N-acetyltransferase [Alloacidobacterium sp.]|uniref:GNAT family N-acetyltransferase n=1 Tax=Alloacidobacterium sp. TaxID=2951999 RepID=UPI002D47F62F|nr:GNAT family N-acetyltransferase [Alloacidobacterium sp.]HYK35738.1 GNAT family N-acetyltransferase [Alloacidobacterium sp.]